jgi:hypothetical protein
MSVVVLGIDDIADGEEDNVAELMRYLFTEVLDGEFATRAAPAGAWA